MTLLRLAIYSIMLLSISSHHIFGAEDERVYIQNPRFFALALRLLDRNVSNLAELLESNELSDGLKELNRLRNDIAKISLKYGPANFTKLVEARHKLRVILTSTGVGQKLIDLQILTPEILNDAIDSIPEEVAQAKIQNPKILPTIMTGPRPIFQSLRPGQHLLYGAAGFNTAMILFLPAILHDPIPMDFLTATALWSVFLGGIMPPLYWNIPKSYGRFEGIRNWVLRNNYRATYINYIVGASLAACINIVVRLGTTTH
jgi:hypothetical protein